MTERECLCWKASVENREKKSFVIPLQKVGMCKCKQERLKNEKKKKEKKPKNKEWVEEKWKIEMKDRSQENEFVTR